MNKDTDLTGLSWAGCKVFYARKTGIRVCTVSDIFRGVRRATLEQAAKLETAFAENGVPLDRVDLLYGYRQGVPLAALIEEKRGAQNAN